MSQPTSEVSLVRIPTASKLKQYSLCPRSVIDVDNPVNSPRQASAPGSAAAVGQSLHLALEVFLIERINNAKSFEDAYSSASSIAKPLGVFSEFCQLDKSLIDSFSKGANKVHTEVSMIMDRNGKSRISKYNSVTKDDALAGTADFIVEYSDKMFIIGDWKTGKDDVDEPHENFQLRSLAAMAYDCFAIGGFSIAIANPTTGQLRISGPHGKPDFDKALVTNPLSVTESAGNHCKYCPLKESCSSFANMIDREVLNVDSETI